MAVENYYLGTKYGILRREIIMNVVSQEIVEMKTDTMELEDFS